jgi:hypothetical protein
MQNNPAGLFIFIDNYYLSVRKWCLPFKNRPPLWGLMTPAMNSFLKLILVYAGK